MTTATERTLTIRPTPAEVEAAQALVRWADDKGEGTVDDYIRAVANYRPDRPEPASAKSTN